MKIELFLRTRGVVAKAVFVDGVLTILKGSEARKVLSTSFPKTQNKLREELIEKKVITEEGDKYVFLQNHICNSPSSGSNLISGSSTNGLMCWKNLDGRKLKTLINNDE